MKWINAKKKLPDRIIDVLVCSDDKRVLVGYLLRDGWRAILQGKTISPVVTHWQPFPDAPK